MLKLRRQARAAAALGTTVSAPDAPRARRAAPSLKRPRTPADFAAIERAQAKRARKGAKLRRDFENTATGSWIAFSVIKLNAQATRREAAIEADALDVARQLDAEQLA